MKTNRVSLTASILYSLGWCCPYRYFFDNRHKPARSLAQQLGVSERTIRRWRADVDIKCENNELCKRHRESS